MDSGTPPPKGPTRPPPACFLSGTCLRSPRQWSAYGDVGTASDSTGFPATSTLGGAPPAPTGFSARLPSICPGFLFPLPAAPVAPHQALLF